MFCYYYCVELEPMTGRHTGYNITEYVTDVKRKFGISKGILVSDWAANMQLGLKESGCEEWIGCFSHALHQCVLHGLKSFEHEINSIKR